MARCVAPLILAVACTLPQRAPPASSIDPLHDAVARAPPASSIDPLHDAVARAPHALYADDAPCEQTAFEARALGEITREIQKAGGSVRRSAALDRAAGVIAEAAVRGDRAPLARLGVQRALGEAAAFDPAPRVHLAIGPPDEALSALLARLSHDGATHIGLAAREGSGLHHVALLLSRRRARLDPFPSTVARGSEARLSGELIGLLHPRVYVSGPDGGSTEQEVEGGMTFASLIRFALQGSYTVEVVGTGGSGPEVAALLTVRSGSDPPDPEPAHGSAPAEPAALATAEATIVDGVNGLRRASELPHLIPSSEIGAIARLHSERMLAAGTVAHVLPGSPELASRLTAARISYRRAFENVARGESSNAAHAAIVASPAHRANLLAPEATLLGVGIARGTLSTGERVVYLTEILIEPTMEAEPDRLTADARVREVLWRERERRGLRPLTNDLALEALARAAATSMRLEDSGETSGLPEAALRLGRGIAAADAFIAGGAAEALRSRNLTDPRFKRVGVGVMQGDSRRFGPGRLYIAVVYSD